MAFYNPLSLNIRGTHIIVYLDQGIEKILERKTDAIQKHLESLLEKNILPKSIDYLIIFLWAEDSEIMSDVWIFTKTNEWGSGPLADARIFQGQKQVNNMGIGSGNTLIVLGKEEEQRRKSKSLDDYLSGPRPKLPGELLLGEDFHK
jgi:hypothetical protein